MARKDSRLRNGMRSRSGPGTSTSTTAQSARTTSWSRASTARLVRSPSCRTRGRTASRARVLDHESAAAANSAASPLDPNLCFEREARTAQWRGRQRRGGAAASLTAHALSSVRNLRWDKSDKTPTIITVDLKNGNGSVAVYESYIGLIQLPFVIEVAHARRVY